jgi:hypothetical protein
MGTSQILEVPLNAGDQKLLKAYSTRSMLDDIIPVSLNTGCGGAVLFLIFLAIWALFIPLGNPFEHQVELWFAATVIAAVIFSPMWADFFKGLRTSPDGPSPIERDLEGGVAKVMTADVLCVVEIKEYEDEGAGFLLQLDDGRVLSVVSQDLYEFTHDIELEEGEEDNRDAFPQTRIEYRYAPHSGLHLGIRGVGKPLKPIGLVKTDKHHVVRSGSKEPSRFIGAEDGTFYEGTLEEVLARLKYTLKPMPAAQ